MLNSAEHEIFHATKPQIFSVPNSFLLNITEHEKISDFSMKNKFYNLRACMMILLCVFCKYNFAFCIRSCGTDIHKLVRLFHLKSYFYCFI